MSRIDKSSGRMQLSLLEIYREIVNEVMDFDNVKPYKPIPNNSGWSFTAEINDKFVNVEIFVEPANIIDFEVDQRLRIAKNVVNFGFEIGEQGSTNQYEKTNFSDYIRILATVNVAMNRFIANNDVDIITFFSDSKFGGHQPDLQKDRVYYAALEKNLPAGFDIGDIFYKKNNKKGIMIYNTRKF